MSIFLIVVYTINCYDFKSRKTLTVFQAQALRGGNDFPTIPKGSYSFAPHLHKPLILTHWQRAWQVLSWRVKINKCKRIVIMKCSTGGAQGDRTSINAIKTGEEVIRALR